VVAVNFTPDGFFDASALMVVAVVFGVDVAALHLAEAVEGVVGVAAGDAAFRFVDEVAVVVVLEAGDFAAGVGAGEDLVDAGRRRAGSSVLCRR